MGAMTCDSPLWLTWFIIWLPGRDLSAALTPLSSTHSPPWPLLYFHLLTLVHWQASLVIALRKIDYQSPFRKEQLFIASPRILRKKKWQEECYLLLSRNQGHSGLHSSKGRIGMEWQWSRSWVQDGGNRVQGWDQEITNPQALNQAVCTMWQCAWEKPQGAHKLYSLLSKWNSYFV